MSPAISSTKTLTLGSYGSSPFTSLPTAWVPHMRPPCSVISNSWFGALAILFASCSNCGPINLVVTSFRTFSSSGVEPRLRKNLKPSSLPIFCPSISILPSSFNSGTNCSFLPSFLNNTLTLTSINLLVSLR